MSGRRGRPDRGAPSGAGGAVLYHLLRAWMRLCARLIPPERRVAWTTEWEGELWYGVAALPCSRRLRAAPGILMEMLADARQVRRISLGNRLGGRGDGVLATGLRDARVGLRGLGRTPGFTGVVVTTLAVGIGGTAALFSMVQALLLKPLPYPDADRLVQIWQGRRGAGVERDWPSPALFGDIRDQTDAFEELALTYGAPSTLSERGRAQEVGWAQVQSTFLDLIGAKTILGRSLGPRDDRSDATEVVLLTEALWERSFGRDPDVVGQSVVLDGVAYPIVGVLSGDVLLDEDVLPALASTGRIDLVRSFPITPEFAAIRNWESYNVVGRLRSNVSLESAQKELDRLAASVQALHEADPDSGFFIEAVPLREQVVGEVRTALLLLMGAAAAVLLVACLNVANLLTARLIARRSELSVRAALGAERGRLTRQLLTESAILAAAGGAMGIAIAFQLVRAVRAQSFVELPRVAEISVDAGVLAFTLAVTGITCVLFGMAPAVRASRADLAGAWRSTGWIVGSRSRARPSLSNALVVTQIGVSLVLLVGGVLLGRSFSALHRVDPGFDPENRLTFRVSPTGPTYATAQARAAFHEEIARRMRTLPGVESVGAVSVLPFTGATSFAPIKIVDYEPPQGSGHEITSAYRAATTGYFETMAIPTVRGRSFDGRDDASGAPVAIIDERFADTYFPETDPIGHQVFFSWFTAPATIVGVAGDVKERALDAESRVTAYFPEDQVGWRGMHVVVSTTALPEALVEPIRRSIEELAPDVAVVDVLPLDERVGSSLAARRLAMALVQGMGAVALALAALGLYGVVSFRVNEGTREIGLRLALGASRASILRMVVGRAMGLGVVGLALGLLAAFGSSGLLRSVLFGVDPIDAPSFAGVAVAAILTTLVASYVPARRATRLDPLVSMKGS